MEFVINRMLESLFEKSQPPSSLYSLTTPRRSTFQPWQKFSEKYISFIKGQNVCPFWLLL
jgi:hypothetical protein